MKPPVLLLGGSFDPVHRGHLALARAAIAAFAPCALRAIPAGSPWQKGEITPGEHRAAMLALALRELPGTRIDRRELDRAGPSYTIDTLRGLRRELGPDVPLVLLLGADQLARLPTWHCWQELTEHAHLAVAQRPGSMPDGRTVARSPAAAAPDPELAPWLAERRGTLADARALAAGRVIDFPMPPDDASSTEARALLASAAAPARDARLAHLLPAAVLDYIRAHHLYSDPGIAHRMDHQQLQRVVVDALEDIKAQDIRVYNTVGLSDLFDRVVIASGNTNRQTRALAWHVVEKVKAAGGSVMSVEGDEVGEWVLVDLGDLVVHIMQPAIRQYYALEEIWGAKPMRVKTAEAAASARPAAAVPAATPAGVAAPLAVPATAAAPSAVPEAQPAASAPAESPAPSARKSQPIQPTQPASTAKAAQPAKDSRPVKAAKGAPSAAGAKKAKAAEPAKAAKAAKAANAVRPAGTSITAKTAKPAKTPKAVKAVKAAKAAKAVKAAKPAKTAPSAKSARPAKRARTVTAVKAVKAVKSAKAAKAVKTAKRAAPAKPAKAARSARPAKAAGSTRPAKRAAR